MSAQNIRNRKSGKTDNDSITSRQSRREDESGWHFAPFLLFTAVTLTVVLSYFHITSPISSVTISDSHDVERISRNLKRNRDLQQAERLVSDLPGPESIALDENNNVYTGLFDGRVVKISSIGTPQQIVTDLTEKDVFTAGGSRSLRRVFGVRIVNNTLYISDAFQGIFSFDLKEMKWEKVVGYQDISPPLMFPNDLVVTKDGKTIYFTDCSERWMFTESAYSFLEGECSGRVIAIDLESMKTEVVANKLCFPNGIELDREEKKLLVSEFGRSRITVLDMHNKRRLNTILLPGGADNIRRAYSGGYWVPLAIWGAPKWHNTERIPILRDIAASIFSHDYLFYSAIGKYANSGTVLKMDEDFNIVGAHFDESGKVCGAISEFHEYKEGEFFIGSFVIGGIGKLHTKS